MTQKIVDNSPARPPGVAAGIQQSLRHVSWEKLLDQYLGFVCAITLAGTLTAGLWPFHTPANLVTWLGYENGLRFAGQGTALSSAAFPGPSAGGDAPCSLEVWVGSAWTEVTGTLLAFYARDSFRQFSLQQNESDLAVTLKNRAGRDRMRTHTLNVRDVFRQERPPFITLTANHGRTAVYVDGALAKAGTDFPFSGRDLRGELIVANQPDDDASWSGRLRGLAFYSQELTPAQVQQHFATWTAKGQPDISEDEHTTALYLFDERAGRVIHNRVPGGINLYLPDRFLVIDEIFFKPFWEEFDPHWGYCKDVLINIAGLIPLGFFFFAYFSQVRRVERPVLLTVLVGFATSLTIEFFQGFLPTRHSGTTDLFTNTLGTWIGAGLFRWNLWRVLLASFWSHLIGVPGED